MALVKCRDCKNFFSTDVGSCIHCGAKKSSNTILKTCKFLIAAFLLVQIVMSCSAHVAYQMPENSDSNAVSNYKVITVEQSSKAMTDNYGRESNLSLPSETDQRMLGAGFADVANILSKSVPFGKGDLNGQIPPDAFTADGLVMSLAKCIIDKRAEEISDLRNGKPRIADDSGKTMIYQCGQTFSNYEHRMCTFNPQPCDAAALEAANFAEHELK